MTFAGLLTIAWHRKAWIAAPAVVTALAAALIGWGLGRRVTYRASILLAVTEGAGEKAVFALKARAVLESALKSARLDGRISPARLRESIGVEVLGENQLRLDVTTGAKDEAERLAEAIARGAAATVSALAKRASEPDVKRVEDLDFKERNVKATIRNDKRDLSKLTIRHEFVALPDGSLKSASRRRLEARREVVAKRRRELAGIEAEIAALRERLAALPDAESSAGRAQAGTPGGAPLEGVEERLRAIDRELKRLRENLTDAHPRVATLLAERALLQAGRAAAGISKPDTLKAELERELRAKESERLRASSVISALERDVKELDAYVRTEAAPAEKEADELRLRIAEKEAELKLVRRLIEEARYAEETNRASRAELAVVRGEPARAVGRAPSPGGLGTAGAVLGLMLGGLLAALAESLDPVIRSNEDVVRHLELPVLAAMSCSAAGGRARTGGSRWAGAALWLGAFLIVAAVMVLLVYPGWERVRAMLSPRGGSGRTESRTIDGELRGRATSWRRTIARQAGAEMPATTGGEG